MSNSPFFLYKIELIPLIIANLQHKSMRTSRIDRCEPRYARTEFTNRDQAHWVDPTNCHLRVGHLAGAKQHPPTHLCHLRVGHLAGTKQHPNTAISRASPRGLETAPRHCHLVGVKVQPLECMKKCRNMQQFVCSASDLSAGWDHQTYSLHLVTAPPPSLSFPHPFHPAPWYHKTYHISLCLPYSNSLISTSSFPFLFLDLLWSPTTSHILVLKSTINTIPFPWLAHNSVKFRISSKIEPLSCLVSKPF